jgi:hypothetical protein
VASRSTWITQDGAFRSPNHDERRMTSDELGATRDE